MNVYELFTCGHYLSEYPNDKTFDELCGMVEEDDENILVYDPFYDCDRLDIAVEMTRMRDALMRLFTPKED